MVTPTRRSKRTAAFAVLAGVTFAVSACTTIVTGGMGGRDLPADVNAADVMFVEMMIPHHEQAMEMADLVLDTDGVEPEVIELAEAIKAAQGPEIDQMEAWLDAWGPPSMGDRGGHGGGHGIGGMMSEEDLQALADAVGPDASRLFLEQMIEHHEGAIEMAQDLLDDGENSDVRELGESIITSQQAEIELMRELLG